MKYLTFGVAQMETSGIDFKRMSCDVYRCKHCGTEIYSPFCYGEQHNPPVHIHPSCEKKLNVPQQPEKD